VSGCQLLPSNSTNDQIKNEHQSGELLAELSTNSGLKFSQSNEDHAQQVLENNFTHQKSEWIDELNTAVLSVMPTRTFSENKRHCREYEATITQAKNEVIINSTACRQNNSIWGTQ